MSKLPKIALEAAIKARALTEKALKLARQGKGPLYEKDFVPTKQIVEHLGGYCGWASYILYKLLPGSELVYGSMDDQGHAWIQYKDWYIDITYTQFQSPESKKRKVYYVRASGRTAMKRRYLPIKEGIEARVEIRNWYNLIRGDWMPEANKYIASHS